MDFLSGFFLGTLPLRIAAVKQRLDVSIFPPQQPRASPDPGITVTFVSHRLILMTLSPGASSTLVRRDCVFAFGDLLFPSELWLFENTPVTSQSTRRSTTGPPWVAP